MENGNKNMKGHWIGNFIQKGEKIEVDFTEDVTVNFFNKTIY